MMIHVVTNIACIVSVFAAMLVLLMCPDPPQPGAPTGTMWKQPTTLLLLLCAPLMVATAQYCTDEYSAEQRYTVENVAVLSINKLNNTVVMFSQDTTAAALDDASVNTLVVRVYDNNTVESVADYVCGGFYVLVLRVHHQLLVFPTHTCINPPPASPCHTYCEHCPPTNPI